MRKCFVTQYCVLSSQITSVGYVGNVICLKFVQESFKVLFEKELVKKHDVPHVGIEPTAFSS